MGYLESLPRRVVTLYMPLGIFVFVLLFPFYWMGTTALKPNAELLSRDGQPVLGGESDARALLPPALRDAVSGVDVEHGDRLGGSTFSSLAASVFAAYAIERLRFKGSKQVGLRIFLAYLVPPSILFIPLATSSSSSASSTRAGR
jgi:multiple sugar transport system permease protein